MITLSIQVDLAGRQALLAAGERIAVVQAMDSQPVNIVVAAVFDPFGDTTAVGFYPQWQGYVMQGAAQPESPVNMQITAAINAGQQLTFDGSQLGNSQGAYTPTVFGLVNASGNGNLSAGLARQLNIANANVWATVAIAGFPENTTSYFTPLVDVFVFLVSGVATGEVLPATILQPLGASLKGGLQPVAGTPSLVGNYLDVPLTANTTIYYDDTTNCFAAGPQGGN